MSSYRGKVAKVAKVANVFSIPFDRFLATLRALLSSLHPAATAFPQSLTA